MDAPVVAGTDGLVVMRAVVDPVTGDTGSGDWVSLILSSSGASSGYVTGADVAMGLLV